MWSPLNLLSKETWILIASILILARYYLHRKWQYFKHLNIPYDPPSVWKLGNMTKFLGDKGFTYENEMKRKYGPVWGSFNLFSPGITVHDPDMLSQIFIKEFHTFPERVPFLKDIVGELHVATDLAVGNSWKRGRSALTPVFSAAKIKQMTYIMDRCTGNMIDALDRIITDNDGIFDSNKIFSRLSLDIICSAAFSTEINSHTSKPEDHEILKRAKEFLSGSLSSPLVMLVFLWPPLGKIARFFKFSIFPHSAVSYFKQVVDFVVEEHRADPNRKNRRVDIMQSMIDSEISEEDAKSGEKDKGLFRSEIIANSMLILVAGNDNVANVMNFMAYSFAQYPHIQRRAQKEVDEIIKEHGKLDYDTVNTLKYMDMCLYETLRMYTPGLRNIRVCHKDITINGFTFPKGVRVSIPSYALSHDPEFWENPEDFLPERMRDGNKQNSMVFLPFGAGPRRCVAIRFAEIEIKMCMAMLLHDFSFETTSDTPKPPLKLTFGITLSSANSFNLRAVKRNQDQ